MADQGETNSKQWKSHHMLEDKNFENARSLQRIPGRLFSRELVRKTVDVFSSSDLATQVSMGNIRNNIISQSDNFLSIQLANARWLAGNNGIDKPAEVERSLVREFRVSIEKIKGEYNLIAMSRNLESLQDLVQQQFQLEYLPELSVYDEKEGKYKKLTNEETFHLKYGEKIRAGPPEAGKSIDYESISRLLRVGIDVRDRKYRRKKYHNCFVGSEAVDWILEKKINGIKSRVEAQQLGEKLLERGLICVAMENVKSFLDKFVFYSFPSYSSQNIANMSSSVLMTSLYIWGKSYPVPQMVHLEKSVCQVVCHSNHLLFITAENGLIFGFGANDSGQLGLDDSITYVAEPTQLKVFEGKRGIFIATGRTQSAAVLDSEHGREVHHWGFFDNHLLPPTSLNSDLLIDEDIAEISLGNTHLLLRSRQGDIWGLGSNYHGQLGVGDYEKRLVPTPIKIDGVVIEISACDSKSGCCTIDGKCYLWGSNADGILGVGTPDASITLPTLVSNLSPVFVQSLSLGPRHNMILTSQGEVFSWGSGKDGRLGLGNEKNTLLPKKLEGVGNIHGICVSNSSSLLWNNRNLYGFGNCRMNKFGILSEEKMFKPTPILHLPAHAIIKACLGQELNCALMVDDLLDIIVRASRREFGQTILERRKIYQILSLPSSKTLQDATRSILLSENASDSKEKRQTPLLLSTYHLQFGLPEDLKCPIFQFHKDMIVLKNESQSKLFFTFPKTTNISYSNHRNFQMNIIPPSGIILPGEVTEVTIQLVLAEVGVLQGYIAVDVEQDSFSFRHFLTFQMEGVPIVKVPEIPYHLLEGGTVIGHGASGFVNRTTWNDTTVAVKHFHCASISKEDIKTFTTEVIIASNLEHPNIIQCFGVSTKFPNLALVLEFCPLFDLRKAIENRDLDFPVPFILRALIDVAYGMSYLHERQIIHRDMKPDNIMLFSLELDAPVVCKISDFGTSKILIANTSTTETGTARYMPPEVIRGEKDISLKVDCWSFGMVVFQLLARALPFDELRFGWQVGDAIINGILPRIDPNWPLWATEIMQACWNEFPEARPSFNEILVTLLDAAREYPALEFLDSKLMSKANSRANRMGSFHRYAQRKTISRNTHKLTKSVNRVIGPLQYQLQKDSNALLELQEKEAELLVELEKVQKQLNAVQTDIARKKESREQLELQIELASRRTSDSPQSDLDNNIIFNTGFNSPASSRSMGNPLSNLGFSMLDNL